MQLQEFCQAIVDCEHKTAPTTTEGYPSIRTPNIGPGYFILDGVNRVSRETYDAWTRRMRPLPGDLIMAREAPVGNVAMIPEGMEPCLGQRTLLIRPNPADLDSRYLVYLLISPVIQGQIHGKTNGATVAHLNMSDVRRLELLVLPPLPIQRRIASILSAYDDLIENHRKRIAILEEMARRLYREWFVHFRYPGHETVPLVDSPMGLIPQGWGCTNIESVCTRIASGSTPSRGNQSLWDDGTIDWFKTQELWDSDLFDAEEKVRPSPTVRIFDPGTILIAIYGASIGRLGLLRSSASCNQAALGLVPDGVRTCRSHLYYTLLELRSHFVGIAQGAAQQNISKEKVAETRFLAPVVEILKIFEGNVGPMLDLRYNLNRQISFLRRTRDLLLPRLMSGTLSVEALATAEAAAS